MELLDNNNIEAAWLEGVEFPTWYRRTTAAILDVVIMALIGYVMALITTFFGVLEYVLLLIAPCYKILLEGSRGATIGKQLMGLKVVTKDGKNSPIGMVQANKRFLLAWPMYLFSLLLVMLDIAGPDSMIMSVVVIFWSLCALAFFSAVSYLFDEQQRTWYDRLANTVCIVDKP